ncbi:MAG: peptide chain release factor N(5)-glutamine methyltransferase [Ruthenibacterium sp.]
MVTLSDAYAASRKALTQAGLEDADFDARILVELVTGLDYYAAMGAPLSEEQENALISLTLKRAEHYPLQYLCGSWDFLDFTLNIGPGVLIPRGDTEIVCEQAIKAVKAAAQENAAPVVVDLCSGSGAIAIALARAVPFAEVTAVELSHDAHKYLRKNVAALAPTIHMIEADVFHWQTELAKNSVDVIVSNPPYLAPGEVATLAPELAFEPKMAFEAAGDALSFYRHIAMAYRAALKPAGMLVFEIGSEQAEAVCDILAAAKYTDPNVTLDYAGLPRAVTARRCVDC